MNREIDRISQEVKNLKGENTKYREQIQELESMKKKCRDLKLELTDKERRITELIEQSEKHENSSNIVEEIEHKLQRIASELIELKSNKNDSTTKTAILLLINEVELLQSKIRSASKLK